MLSKLISKFSFAIKFFFNPVSVFHLYKSQSFDDILTLLDGVGP